MRNFMVQSPRVRRTVVLVHTADGSRTLSAQKTESEEVIR